MYVTPGGIAYWELFGKLRNCISLDTGLCGAAVTSGQVVVVHDVSKDSRYLSGSWMVKCEGVVPIFVKKKPVAELDIESYFANPVGTMVY